MSLLRIYQDRHSKLFPWTISSATQACHGTLASYPRGKALRKKPGTPAAPHRVTALFPNPCQKSNIPNTCTGLCISSLPVVLNWGKLTCGRDLSLTKGDKRAEPHFPTEVPQRGGPSFQFQGSVLSFGIFLCPLNMISGNSCHMYNHLFAFIDLRF